MLRSGVSSISPYQLKTKLAIQAVFQRPQDQSGQAATSPRPSPTRHRCSATADRRVRLAEACSYTTKFTFHSQAFSLV